MQIITNVEDAENGTTRGWIVPDNTSPTDDLELAAVDHIDIPATEDEAEWNQSLRDILAAAGYALTGAIEQDGAHVTARVEQV